MPVQIPKDLLDMRDDVLNVRLSAANTSLWSIAASVTDRVDRAINDALMAYPFMVRATAYSIRFMPSNMPVVLPSQAERILEVCAYHASDMTTRVQVNQYRHVPTLWTNFLNVEIPEYAMETSLGKSAAKYWLSVEYEYRQKELPKPLSLEFNMIATQTSIGIRRMADLVHYWPEDGFAALRPTRSTAAALNYEIIWYGGKYMFANAPTHWSIVIPPPAYIEGWGIMAPDPQIGREYGGLGNIQRGQMGTFRNTFSAMTDSVWISPIIMLPPEAYAVIILEAQANMYQYWVAHRTAYDQWAASSQMQQMDSSDIIALVETLRMQAQEKYIQLNHPVKKAPTGPTYMQLERRKGTGV